MPIPDPGPIYEFSGCRLDCERFELLRNGYSLRVERKPLELLILLVSREGKLVTRTEIAERLWPSDVFVDTEHGINTAIRKLRQILHDDSEEPQFIQTVTGMGYRFVAPVVTLPGSPLATKGEEDSEETVATATRSRGRWWMVLAALAVLVAAVLAIPFHGRSLAALWLHHGSERAIKSIAVLPLSNFSGDPGQDYFAAGMTDELITMLAKDSTLSVTSRTSAMRYNGSTQPMREIAQALHVDGIIEGSVSRSGNEVHMTLQLIRADSDTHVWAESYDRSTNDAVDLPDEAAREIANRLHSSVATSARPRPVNPEAHDAYLRGEYLTYAFRFDEARKYFEKATEIDPNYAMGWAGIASCDCQQVMHGDVDPRQLLEPCYEMAKKALELDPDSAMTHLTMAGALFIAKWDLKNADEEIRRAIAIDPKNAEAYHLRARILIAMHRGAEAIEVQKRQMELDPFARPWGMAETYFETRHYKDVVDEVKLRLENSPNNIQLLLFLVTSYHCLGDDDQAVDTWARIFRVVQLPASAVAVKKIYRKGGYKAVERWQLEDNERQAKTRYFPPTVLASYYAEVGDREDALAYLEEAVRQHHPWVLWAPGYQEFDYLHSDPRFRSIMRQIDASTTR
jgi:TolB-like protein/DNA-binding winged helix-turn-helix (wHTH) protein